jgi:hypothetical protein
MNTMRIPLLAFVLLLCASPLRAQEGVATPARTMDLPECPGWTAPLLNHLLHPGDQRKSDPIVQWLQRKVLPKLGVTLP